jgi:hypothetical protein
MEHLHRRRNYLDVRRFQTAVTAVDDALLMRGRLRDLRRDGVALRRVGL